MDEFTGIGNNEFDKSTFDSILESYRETGKEYEKKSLNVFMDLSNSIQLLNNSKIEPVKQILKDIDELIKLIEFHKGNQEVKLEFKKTIWQFQNILSNYLDMPNENKLILLNKNLNKLNQINKEYSSSKEVYGLVVTNIMLDDKQKELHLKLEKIINENKNKSIENFEKLNFDKLDNAYKELYEANESNYEEIINKRGRLIRLLKHNDNKIKNKYEEVKTLKNMKSIFDTPNSIDDKMNAIKQLLQRKENAKLLMYFSPNINNYNDLKQDFNRLYNYMEVKKVERYKGALNQELERHNETLRFAYNDKMLNHKKILGDESHLFRKTSGLAVQKLSNSIQILRKNDFKRKQKEIVREVAKDLGRVVFNPLGCVIKTVADNWNYINVFTLLTYALKINKFKDPRIKIEKEKEKERKKGQEPDKGHVEDRILNDRDTAIKLYQTLHPELSKQEVKTFVDSESDKYSYEKQVEKYQKQLDNLKSKYDAKAVFGVSQRNIVDEQMNILSKSNTALKEEMTNLTLGNGISVSYNRENLMNRTVSSGNRIIKYKKIKTDEGEILRCVITDTKNNKISVFEQKDSEITLKVYKVSKNQLIMIRPTTLLDRTKWEFKNREIKDESVAFLYYNDALLNEVEDSIYKDIILNFISKDGNDSVIKK